VASKILSLSGKKRIYLVDGQPLVHEWLTHVLNNEPDMVVCGGAVNVSSATRAILALNPHVAIIDLAFDDGSGFDLIEKINLRCPRTAVLVLSMHDEMYYADRVLRAGAKGYISKKEPTKRIVVAVRCLLQGQLYLSPDGVQLLMKNRVDFSTSREARSVEILSDREIEVFAMLGRGLGPRRIAQMLHLSPKTVHAYSARIKAKLQLRDGTELLREAIRWLEKTADHPASTPRTLPRAHEAVIDLSLRHLGRPSKWVLLDDAIS
jgi:DNA-binding NarL/FixJ family response regulator